jgi:hypothetical protein
MIDSEVEKILNQLHMHRAVDRTRVPLRPPERKLNARPTRPGESSNGPISAQRGATR